MADYEIAHDRKGCIGCGACTAAAPEFWSMGDDGKAELNGSKGNRLQIGKKDLDKNMEAAQACPVSVIHIRDLKGKKELV